MSFRSIGGLPKCLRGRLAFRQTPLSCDRALCLRCSSNFAQAAAHNDGNDGHPRVPDTDQAAFAERGAQPTQRARYIHRSDIANDAAGPNIHSNVQRADRSPPNQTKPSIRTGSIPTSSSIILAKPVAEAPSSGRDDKKPTPKKSSYKNSTLLQEQGRYQEWEEIHDKFLEVRRSRPAETAAVFGKHVALARRYVGDTSNPEATSHIFQREWSALKSDEQIKLLPSLLIGSLIESPAAILFVLSNVGQIPYSARIRLNCLRAVGLMYYKELYGNSTLKSTYNRMIEDLRSPKCWPKDALPAVLLQTLLFWSGPEQCQRIIEDFFEKYPEADSSSLIAIIDHYLRIKDQERAFYYLARLPTEMLQQPDSHLKSLRDRLIMLDNVVRSESGTNFKYLPQLLALGIPPDEALHNKVIESAINNDMPDVAWDVYQYLETSNLQSNARTNLVLLRDSFQREDLQRVNDIMTTIHSRDDLVNDQYLVAYSMNIVRVISYFKEKLKPKEALLHIMALYDRAYDRTPLVKIGVVPPLEDSTDLPMPSPTSLAFTIWTYILIQRRDRDIVLRLWEWIKYLISTGDEAMIEAARYDIIYNGLMLFHARNVASLFRTFEVVQFMLSSKLCLPTSRTWSILLCSLLKHGQLKQAEKVLALMRSKGVRIQDINEKYSDYIPVEHDLQTMYDRIDQSLDERDMPAGIEELLAESKSLQ